MHNPSRRAFVASVVAAGLLAQGAFAAVNAYLRIEGIDGTATDFSHRGWIEVESFQWGTGSMMSGGAGHG